MLYTQPDSAGSFVSILSPFVTLRVFLIVLVATLPPFVDIIYLPASGSSESCCFESEVVFNPAPAARRGRASLPLTPAFGFVTSVPREQARPRR